MAKRWAISNGDLPRGGLPKNSVGRLTDRPDMTSAVDRGRKALTQTNKIFYREQTLNFFVNFFLTSRPHVYTVYLCPKLAGVKCCSL